MGKTVREFSKNSAEKIRVSIVEFRGKTYGDIRVYYQDDDGEFKPTKKGVTFAPDILPQIKEGVSQLEQELLSMGLMETTD